MRGSRLASGLRKIGCVGFTAEDQAQVNSWIDRKNLLPWQDEPVRTHKPKRKVTLKLNSHSAKLELHPQALASECGFQVEGRVLGLRSWRAAKAVQKQIQ